MKSEAEVKKMMIQQIKCFNRTDKMEFLHKAFILKEVLNMPQKEFDDIFDSIILN